MSPGVVLVDLDGVVWRSDAPITGASNAVELLRSRGIRVAFFTNNSYIAMGDLLTKLSQQGVEADEHDLLTSAQAAASLLGRGSVALVLGGQGCLEALVGAGVEVVRCDGKGAVEGFDAVVVGLDPAFDYERLAQAMSALRHGARLIGTNSDATWPTSGGERPGGGSLLAAVATASSVEPIVAGKPNEPAVRLVEERLGDVDLVIGDRPSTDGAFARRLGASFGLVLSGVTPPGHGPLDPPPDLEEKDLVRLTNVWLSGPATARG